MSEEIFFRIVQIAVLAIFFIFVSDQRRKKGMEPLVNKRFIYTFKIAYVIPFIFYIYVLLMLRDTLFIDYLALFFTSVGAFLVIKSKKDLGKLHTFTGYHIKNTKLITRGIYAYMRHPLYTGVYLFIIGSAITLVFHASLWMLIVIGILLLYIIPFLIVMSIKETGLLEKQYGSEFFEYKRKVHAFLPLRKFK